MGTTRASAGSSRGKDKQGASKVETGLVIERVALAGLIPWPGNARVGDLGVIVESLEVNGQYRPLVVQRSSNQVIAGNHTLEAMLSLGWTEADVSYLDVDDNTAKRILLVDNKSQDIADYDWKALTELIDSLDGLVGSGYVQSELDALLKIQADLVDELADIDAAFPEDGDDDDDDALDDGLEEPDLDSKVYRMDSSVTFLPTGSRNKWDIPELLPDMIPEVGDDIQPWVGPIISEALDTGNNQFLYQYSTDSTRSMPWERTIVGFYTQDERFENWWTNPEYYITRVLNANIAGLITPDWSQYGSDPMALSLHNTYRAFWIGRFAQEAGLKVIPNLSARDGELGWALAGVPKNPKTAAIQVQTTKVNDTDEERRKAARVHAMVEAVNPETLIVYGGPRGQSIIESIGIKCRVIYVPNRSVMKDRWKEERDQALVGEHTQPAS